MKKRKLLLHIFCFLTLLNIAILCNESIAFAADTSAPTACNISINKNSSYTNNRLITLDIYAEDESDMQVWISNDGVTGTVTAFEIGSTLTITDSNYVIGTTLDSSNSTTTSNSDNVFRIQNWPVEDGNGTRTVRVVFNDAYGNKTSLEAYDTITISYDLNGIEGTVISSEESLPGLDVYLPKAISTSDTYTFIGWCTSNTATIPNYTAETAKVFTTDTVLYALFEKNEVYVTLYTDGTLGFDNTTATISGKTVSKSYGDIAKSTYTLSSSVPWYSSRASITTVEFVNKVSPQYSTAWWFYDCSRLTTIKNISNLDTSNVTNMSRMFYNCRRLANLDVSSFNTAKVTNMSYMFYSCEPLTNLDLSNFNTANVTNMSYMFWSCKNLTKIYVSSSNWTTATTATNMFDGCGTSTLTYK